MIQTVDQKVVDDILFHAFVVTDTIHWFVWALDLTNGTGTKRYSGGAADIASAEGQAQKYFDQAIQEHPQGD
jgi:hypothetical protein